MHPNASLGNPSVPTKITAENTVLLSTPSSILSSPGKELENDLAVIVAAWPRIPAAVRTALIAAAIASSHEQ